MIDPTHMTEWDPKRELGMVGYLQFRRGRWVQVSTVPPWVRTEMDNYYQTFIREYGNPPYDIEQTYSGDGIEYKVYYNRISRNELEEEYYIKKS